ncbi:hypothetical protein H4S02_000043 [Coemansia sp. RSA 2611]|nr:hypothetical protein H4S02_000043 [Coemansia sp. RSA 2611]
MDAVKRMVGQQPPQAEQELQAALDYERGHSKGLADELSKMIKCERLTAEIAKLEEQLSELEAKYNNLLQASAGLACQPRELASTASNTHHKLPTGNPAVVKRKIDNGIYRAVEHISVCAQQTPRAEIQYLQVHCTKI